ncbi:MAG: hypothetical protein ACYTG4_06935 [Planctomycetota bacterium]|jgi:hypothetical protein
MSDTTEPNIAVDLVGMPVGDTEQQVLRMYEETKALLERDDLPPFMQRNLRKSLACLYQCVNDLNLTFEHLYDQGV